VYGGTFYESRSPLPVAKAYLEYLKQGNADRFCFDLYAKFSPDSEEAAFRKYLKEVGLEKAFHVYPLISRDRFLDELGRSDVLMIVTHASGSDYAVPGKIFDYLSMQRPLLIFSSDRGIFDLLNGSEIPFFATALEVEQITKLFSEMDRKLKANPALFANFPKHAIERFNCYEQAKILKTPYFKIKFSLVQNLAAWWKYALDV
jgi:hypothetical protein